MSTVTHLWLGGGGEAPRRTECGAHSSLRRENVARRISGTGKAVATAADSQDEKRKALPQVSANRERKFQTRGCCISSVQSTVGGRRWVPGY